MATREELISALEKSDEAAALALLVECLASMGAKKLFEGGYAARWVCSALYSDKKDLARKMVEAMGPVVDLGDKERFRIVERAANRGQLEVVRALMKPGDGERRLVRGLTLMMQAACGGQLEMLKFLLPHSDVSARDEDGYSVLEHAARTTRLECVKWGLSLGVKAGDKSVSPLLAAIGPHSYRDSDVVALLLEREDFSPPWEHRAEEFRTWFAQREKLNEEALGALDGASMKISSEVALAFSEKAKHYKLDLPALYARVEKLQLESLVMGGVSARKLSL